MLHVFRERNWCHNRTGRCLLELICGKRKDPKWPLRWVGILSRNMLCSALRCCWHFCIRPALNKHLQLMVMIGNWSCSVAWSEPQLLWRLDGLAAWVCCQTLQVCQPPHFLSGCSEQSLSSQWEAVHHSVFSKEAVHHQSLSTDKLSTTQNFSARKLSRASQCRIRELNWASRMRLICLCQNSVVYSWPITMKIGCPNMNYSTELSERKLTKKRKMIEQIAVYTSQKIHPPCHISPWPQFLYISSIVVEEENSHGW